ncbi:hypothetical protein KW787_00075 [Candidatus Pacearchaeota archaeon]|nr:hypothetical protein [Candidatus Pacearchaeota archaeon]
MPEQRLYSVQDLVKDLIDYVSSQRKNVDPIGRLDIYGRPYYDNLISSLQENKDKLGISSIEAMSNYTCVVFKDGLRPFDIDLEGISRIWNISAKN